MKQSETVNLVRVIWRWRWLIVILMVLVVGGVFLKSRLDDEVYQAEITLLVSTPDNADVAAIDVYTFRDKQDLITAAINSFVQVAQYDEVKRRTQTELNISTDYDVTVDTELGAEFVYLTVEANDAELAQQIANTHAQVAITYFGELRSLPASEALDFFEQELSVAEQTLLDARVALSDFQIDHDVISLDREIAIAESVLEQLELTYAELSLPDLDTGEASAASQTDLLNVRHSIETQRARIAELTLLQPEYNSLVEAVDRAQADYTSLSEGAAETELRQSFARQAMFIQIIKPAELPSSPVNSTVKMLVLGGIASLGLGVLLAFTFEYFLYARRSKQD